MIYDAAIVGGGPGGSTAANVLARDGFRVVVLERERFPRFHVGESLLPASVRLYDRLELRPVLDAAGFVRKYGAQFVSNEGSVERCFDFFRGEENPDNLAYEVERAEFDHLLLKEASRRGAEVREETTVLKAEPREGAPGRLRIRDREGREEDLEARWILDASGQQSFLSRQFGLREVHPTHKKVALFSHFRGAVRRQGRLAGNIDLVLSLGGWFWLIPLKDDATSVGFVVSPDVWKESGLSKEAFLDRAISRSPYVARRLQKADRFRDVHVVSDYSYGSKRFTGPGFTLVGDAAMFLDPIFSTGVHLAMSSGELAAQDLGRGLRSGRPVTARHFRRYEKTVRRWMRNYFTMVEAYYSPGFATMFLNPKNTFGIQDAVIGLLAGTSDPGWGMRWRLRMFYALLRLN